MMQFSLRPRHPCLLKKIAHSSPKDKVVWSSCKNIDNGQLDIQPSVMDQHYARLPQVHLLIPQPRLIGNIIPKNLTLTSVKKVYLFHSLVK